MRTSVNLTCSDLHTSTDELAPHCAVIPTAERAWPWFCCHAGLSRIPH